MDENFSLIPISADMPEGTDFCLIMDTELMEPLIAKGSRLCVSRHQDPEPMDVGLFFYRGRVLCRQVCEDYAGNLHLLCANPKAEKENLCLDRKERSHCLCLGRVLLREKPPAPVYV